MLSFLYGWIALSVLNTMVKVSGENIDHRPSYDNLYVLGSAVSVSRKLLLNICNYITTYIHIRTFILPYVNFQVD